VVALAAEQDPRALWLVWVDLGFIAANIVHTNTRPPPDRVPDDLEFGLRVALRAAEPLALRCFCASDWNEKTSWGGSRASCLALACLALSRHPVGQLVVGSPGPPQAGKDFISQQFVNAVCFEC
jgi:hypothetical protein